MSKAYDSIYEAIDIIKLRWSFYIFPRSIFYNNPGPIALDENGAFIVLNENTIGVRLL